MNTFCSFYIILVVFILGSVYFMLIKTAAKAKRVELNEDFINMWKDETKLWDVTSSYYRNRDARSKSLKTLDFTMTDKT